MTLTYEVDLGRVKGTDMPNIYLKCHLVRKFSSRHTQTDARVLYTASNLISKLRL